MSLRTDGLSISLLAAAVLLAGCTLSGPDSDSEIAVPQQWQFQPPVATHGAVDAEWWQQFGSAELNQLIQQAQLQSLDLQAAMARLQQAQARAGVAGASLLPTLELGLDAKGERRIKGEPKIDRDALELGFKSRYELDLWGRNRALRDAAKAQWQASRFDLDTVRISLSAGVAERWMLLAGLRERLSIARLNLENAQRVLKTVEARYQAGAAIALELAQQRSQVAEQQRLLAQMQMQAREAEVALALLLGQPVTDLSVKTESLEALRWQPVDAGLPSELLLRRPDLARDEARLQAANANVVAARAALLPSINLSANVGYSAESWGQLLDNALYGLTGAALAPVFNGGKLRAERDLAEAQQLELLAAYRKSIVAAFADVETGLNAISGLDAQIKAHDERLNWARRAFEQAEVRYRAGAETLLVLLEAQQAFYQAQDQQVSLKQARLQASVALYRALGGGWRS